MFINFFAAKNVLRTMFRVCHRVYFKVDSFLAVLSDCEKTSEGGCAFSQTAALSEQRQ